VPGQKVDFKISSKDIELAIGEIASPRLLPTKTVKSTADRHKLTEGMKDILNKLLLTKINGCSIDDIRKMAVFGIQVIGISSSN
jgi:predicted regulator of amino acid metabolism with ACT domain